MENVLQAENLTFGVFCWGLLCKRKSSPSSDRTSYAPHPPAPAPVREQRGTGLPLDFLVLYITKKPPRFVLQMVRNALCPESLQVLRKAKRKN